MPLTFLLLWAPIAYGQAIQPQLQGVDRLALASLVIASLLAVVKVVGFIRDQLKARDDGKAALLAAVREPVERLLAERQKTIDGQLDQLQKALSRLEGQANAADKFAAGCRREEIARLSEQLHQSQRQILVLETEQHLVHEVYERLVTALTELRNLRKDMNDVPPDKH